MGSIAHLPFLLVPWVLGCGLYGIVTSRHLVHLVICVGVVQTSTYVLLLLVGFREGGGPPVFHDVTPGVPSVIRSSRR